jgi:mono/diheme cytochrome c family protein
MRKILFASAIGLIFLSIGFAAFQQSPWVVPPEAKEKKNPLMASEEHLKAAKAIYMDHCANCHGDAGKGDGSEAMMYDPAPADFTDAAKMSRFTDGEMYFQITQGRKPMPSFRNRLTEEQRWEMVLLVRSFAIAATTEKQAEGPKAK